MIYKCRTHAQQDVDGSLGAMACIRSTDRCRVVLVNLFAIVHSYIVKIEALVDTCLYQIIVVLVYSTSTLEKWRMKGQAPTDLVGRNGIRCLRSKSYHSLIMSTLKIQILHWASCADANCEGSLPGGQ